MLPIVKYWHCCCVQTKKFAYQDGLCKILNVYEPVAKRIHYKKGRTNDMLAVHFWLENSVNFLLFYSNKLISMDINRLLIEEHQHIIWISKNSVLNISRFTAMQPLIQCFMSEEYWAEAGIVIYSAYSHSYCEAHEL